MSEKTIKPCPFCGGRGELLGSRDTDVRIAAFWVSCQCGAEGPIKSSEQKALAAWNKRYF